MSILFVFTSADKNLKGGQTGWYLPEAAHPYYVLAPHFKVDFASPKGANPPVDEGSVKNFTDKESVEFLKDETVKAKLASAKKLSDVDAKDYDAIFYVGGHGPVLDLATDPVNIKLASDFYNAGKITSAVCHGPAALVGVQTTDGKSIFAGKKAVGFSNVEEEQAGAVETIPFLLEDRIKSLGGEYIKADPWQPKVIVDGHLITGQNPASALPLGEALLKALQNK
ncbi:class I glutamine amidotransferase-like protein [Gymnopus androsaceus JB14]|uniref:D-lactate dehydratase n=1 Tax=Gymnopus androsaceus JB14 TaxID=1447944 RepID=A0A6A4III8_9AGAR|nr:class I glutamine amidotransferase-like protein [Gymnopus androsaceus JB14]